MRRFVPIAFALATLTVPLAAQGPSAAAHPDFVGTWKLDPKKSEGPGIPISMTLKVAKDAKVLSFSRTAMTQAGEQGSTMIVNLDGTPTKNTLLTQGVSIDFFLKSAWDGPAFVIKTNANIGGQVLDQTDRWTLDPNGTTMHIQTTTAGANQTISLKLTLEKQ
jgi:hypothetical protein